ncbi:glycoside hydrolase family 3 C-terminal domain-containing protein [Pseudonocardia sp. TRM90224]|uniref:glycoside hydrolase family 3 C-terminal domain-containing protein n=1 Tax=Pseudonocardia sp. TRM90224 TaxID=2812678 RepID=UPI001E601A38|nr:glycoside hydrolase family 3 C-terminal domain-containing protein [Pseudonocardia sp. TRM90224]
MDVDHLTVAQKAALSIGSSVWDTAAVPEHDIESITLSDGPHGLRYQPADEQDDLIKGRPATCFPTASALGSSWDEGLAAEVGAAIGVEARASGVAVVLGPGVNIKRTPLCGRNFEYFSEDPFLSGRMGAALVEGLQSQQVGASLKHFAANNQETERLRISADVDERTLREIYLPAFEHIVTTARPWTVMCAYNKVNGTFASQHRELLTGILRDEWGFDGLVVSDWGAVHDRVAAMIAGLDLEMPPNTGISDRAVVEAVADGSLAEDVLDESVRRLLRLVEQARERKPATADLDAHHTLARRAAAESMVLLKNDGGVLPIADSAGLTVAVLGEMATVPRYQGAGSSLVSATRVDIPLDALAAALPAATVRLAGSASDVSGADVAVAFLGLPPAVESEGFDRADIDLPADQVALLEAVAATGVPVVVVLCNGSAVRTSTWDHHTAAVLECWLGGQAVGSAVADVLTGAVAPSGRLTETIPLRLQDSPSFLNFPGEEGHVRYGEGVFVGYRGFDASDTAVAYPFGHGLTYTEFTYSALDVSVAGSADEGTLAITVAATVTNTGARAGQEVVQLYVGDPVASVARPPRELKGFTKVRLGPGEHTTVTFPLAARDLSFWSIAKPGWLLEPGEFTIAVGASSRDLRLSATITVDATLPRQPLTVTSTLGEWLADPAGAALIAAAVGDSANGLFEDQGTLRMMAPVPLDKLVLFQGTGVTRAMLDELVARLPG